MLPLTNKLNINYRTSINQYKNNNVIYIDYNSNKDYILTYDIKTINAINNTSLVDLLVTNNKLKTWYNYPKINNILKCNNNSGNYLVLINNYSDIILKYKTNTDIQKFNDDLIQCISNNLNINNLIKENNIEEIYRLLLNFSNSFNLKTTKINLEQHNLNYKNILLDEILDDILSGKNDENDTKNDGNGAKNDEKVLKKRINRLMLEYSKDKLMSKFLYDIIYNKINIFDSLGNILTPFNLGYKIIKNINYKNDSNIENIYCNSNKCMLIKEEYLKNLI